MKKNRLWITAVAVILTGILYAGYCDAAENEPVREPVYESPRVYKDDNGKVVFKEFIEDLTVSRIEFYDPDSGELLYGVSLQDGRLDGKREGSAVGENNGPFDEKGDIKEHVINTISGKIVFVTWEYNGELVEYKALGKGMDIPLIISIQLKKGRIILARRNFIMNNEIVEFNRGYGSEKYNELYFHNDGTRTWRQYRSGFLWHEERSIPAEGGGNLTPYNAYYLSGKLAFIKKTKSKYNFIQGQRNWYIEEIAIYDSQDKLIAKANPVSGNPVLGENLFLKEEVVGSRKALQVIRKRENGQEKVLAVKFED